MRTKLNNCSGRQRGASLIGLMVGLLVSLIGILGSLSLYKSLTQTSVDATFDAKHDGNVSIALTRITNLVQNAGFGLDKPTNIAGRHLILDGEDLIWRTREVVAGATFDPSDAATYTSKCYRLHEQTVAGSNEKQIEIDSGTCNEVTPLATLAGAWAVTDPKKEVINRTSLDRLDAVYKRDKSKITLLNIVVDPNFVDCTPYGMIAPPTGETYENVLVTFSHFTSTDLNKIADQDNITQSRSLSQQVCIGNPVYE